MQGKRKPPTIYNPAITTKAAKALCLKLYNLQEEIGQRMRSMKLYQNELTWHNHSYDLDDDISVMRDKYEIMLSSSHLKLKGYGDDHFTFYYTPKMWPGDKKNKDLPKGFPDTYGSVLIVGFHMDEETLPQMKKRWSPKRAELEDVIRTNYYIYKDLSYKLVSLPKWIKDPRNKPLLSQYDEDGYGPMVQSPMTKADFTLINTIYTKLLRRVKKGQKRKRDAKPFVLASPYKSIADLQ